MNQEEYDRDMPKLFDLWKRRSVTWIGLSVEPQLGPIKLNMPVHWVISGGESLQPGEGETRHYDLAWARSLRDQCAAAGVAYFQKQLGARPTFQMKGGARHSYGLKDRQSRRRPERVARRSSRPAVPGGAPMSEHRASQRDEWAGWTDQALIDWESDLYQQEVDGADTWELRDAVLWEMNMRGLCDSKRSTESASPQSKEE